VSFASKLQTLGFETLAPAVFYGAAGIVLLALLPFSNFPPHVGLTGILSLINAYGILKKRFWAFWLVVALFFVAMAFSLYTLFFIGFSNWVVSTGMVAYAVLTLVFTLYIVLKRQAPEA
jgi:hypothetical protein